MSDNSQVIVDVEATEDQARHLAENIREWLVGSGIVQAVPSDCILGKGQGYAPGPRYQAALAPGWTHHLLRLRLNGLSIEIGRQVVDAGGNGLELTCTGCGATFSPGSEWADAVGAWFDGDDNASFACPSCRAAHRLTDWRGPWQWGFGHLALRFWNWPPLAKSFLRDVEEQLRHRTILVRSHL